MMHGSSFTAVRTKDQRIQPTRTGHKHTSMQDSTLSKQQSCILWSHHEERRELPGETDNARNNARCMQARKTMHSLDGQHQDVEESIRMTQDRDKWRKYVHCVANPQIKDG